MNAPAPLLEVTGLTVAIDAPGGPTYPVHDVSLRVRKGEVVGVVGESGCGKSTLLRAVADVLPRGFTPVAGQVRLDGHPVERRSGAVAMIFQDPMTGLNPVMTVGEHVTEVPRRRDGLGRSQARDLAIHLLSEVGIEDAEERLGAYPHQLSGGLRQRVLIAAALSGDPELLLCDEPTTALDVTVQARFIALLRRIVADRGIGILYVTHDLPLLGTMCDRINVMYAGEVIERGAALDVLRDPTHPYTAALLAAAPRLGAREQALASIPGQPPALTGDLTGCRFAPRCPHVTDGCAAARGLGVADTGHGSGHGSGHESGCVRAAELAPLAGGGAR